MRNMVQPGATLAVIHSHRELSLLLDIVSATRIIQAALASVAQVNLQLAV